MAGDRIICETNSITYMDIRKAMINGARSMQDMKDDVGVCGSCEGCTQELPGILQSLCGCKEVSMQTVVDAVNNGANTVEQVMEQTCAGTGDDCGKCQGLIANVIELGR